MSVELESMQESIMNVDVPTTEQSQTTNPLSTSDAVDFTPELPVELWKSIFDFLEGFDDDLETLRTCAAVCRLFSNISRPHIFRLVLVRFGDSALQFRGLIEANASITDCVRELAICAPDPTIEASEPITEPHVYQTINLFLGLFPKLQTMMLMGLCEIGDHSPLELFQVLQTFSSVTRLEILGCKFSRPLLLAYITSFPALRSLGLNTIVPYEDHSVELPQGPVPKLERVRFRTVEAPEQSLPWLASSDSIRFLRSANLDVYQWEPGLLERFLAVAGPTLIELDLKLVNTEVSGINCDSTAVDLSKATALQTLTLRTALCDATLNALPTITSPHLKYLRFSVPPIQDSHLQVYQVLADHLARQKFPPSFEEIGFIFKRRVDEMDLEVAKIRSLFEKSGAKYRITALHTSQIKRWWLSMQTV